jgi:DNA-binding NarL/FixJ family response regulator
MALRTPTSADADVGHVRTADPPRFMAAGDVPAAERTDVGVHPIRVLIADGRLVVRAGLQALLDDERDLTVVGAAADGDETVRLAGHVRPDLIVLDAAIPGLDAVTVTARVVDDPQLSGARVILLALDDTDDRIFEALRAGASGILDKSSDPADLVEALRVVASGAALLSPGATERLMTELASQPQPHIPNDEQLRELTPREREVMTLLATGLSNDQIAERLVISRATAKTHLSRALSKLEVRDRAQLVAVAYQLGLVQPGDSVAIGTNVSSDTTVVVA